mgnify:CR=1 FL=1
MAECSLPLTYQQVNPVAFEPAIAPHLAAREAGGIGVEALAHGGGERPDEPAVAASEIDGGKDGGDDSSLESIVEEGLGSIRDSKDVLSLTRLDDQ